MDGLNRRDFLKAGAVATSSTAADRTTSTAWPSRVRSRR